MTRAFFPMLPSARQPRLVGAPTVAILAGGLGTRLRSVVNDRPKVLAEISGRPFLSFWLETLAQQGFREVVICAGYLAEQVEQCLGDTFGPLQLRYSIEPQPLGTGGALRLASDRFSTDQVMVLNGDSFCEVDLAAFWKAHLERRLPASMVLRYEEDTRRYGRVTLSSDGRLENFLEKSDLIRPGWINAGIYLLPKDWISRVPAAQAISLERDLLPGWMGEGIYGFPSAGRFIDIGTPESFARAGEFFADAKKLAA
ncbi:MAG: nucleotidyltransferase family protein [Verrucomicrobiales bacterium]|nr:nucleotidyltransferase family protein [Verrucomicrobiales bacterium]